MLAMENNNVITGQHCGVRLRLFAMADAASGAARAASVIWTCADDAATFVHDDDDDDRTTCYTDPESISDEEVEDMVNVQDDHADSPPITLCLTTPVAKVSRISDGHGARLRATFACLPEELYPLIVAHVSLEDNSLASLALVSDDWNRAVRAHMTAPGFWQANHPAHASPFLPVQALQTLGALACRCREPSEVVALVREMLTAADDENDFKDLFLFSSGVEVFGGELTKCAQADNWTGELIVKLSDLLFGSDVWLIEELHDARTHECDLSGLVAGMRTRSALNRGFSAREDEVFAVYVAHLARSDATEPNFRIQSLLIMEHFASFVGIAPVRTCESQIARVMIR